MTSTDHDLFELSPDGPAGIHRTMADRVTVEIHRLIIMGDLEPGSALPIRDLADRFGTSSMPVREALRRLGGLGLVEITPHRGARVAETSVEDLEDTYRVRLLLEPLAVAAAAESVDDAHLDRAADALARHNAAIDAGDLDRARTAHTEFHFLLYQGAASRWLQRAIEPVWQNSDRYRFAASGREKDRSRAEHTEILEACRAHDATAAEAAMRRHLEGARDRIRAAMLARRG
ncbi:GntR family transcriptional regulator [Georgenia ruanii]|uniref:FCD domain-containing protein n=1 Tax=Georgenia ruanii TaxID=348442 RepID=A0A7J9UWW7_9MICO|nr:GntR family transcriptional regulator [Georgenia ruanii]MPV89121.1 FCD domain-containing protein [Georgenia ruanii]